MPRAKLLCGLAHIEEASMIRIRRTCQLVGVLLLATAAGVAIGSTALADPTGAQSQLTAVTGIGTGKVVISPTSADQGTFNARVMVNVYDAAPDTTFAVTRGGGDGVPDGICNGTVFGQVATLTTSPGGAGAVEFERSVNTTPSGSRFDLMLRLLGSDGSVLESQCMTITAK
jgi:hypothetical protein